MERNKPSKRKSTCDTESDGDENMKIQGKKRAMKVIAENFEKEVSCLMCRKSTKTPTDIMMPTLCSNLTYFEVLSKLLQEAQDKNISKNVNISGGCICQICKYLITNLLKLQKEMEEIRNIVLSMLMSEDNAKSVNPLEPSTIRIRKDLFSPLPEMNFTNAEKTDCKKVNNEKVSKSAVCVEKDDDEYLIEALLDKKGTSYLVKWKKYPSAYNSWEPSFALPPAVIKVSLTM